MHYIELYTVFLIKLNVFHVAWRVLLWVGNVLLQAATGQPQAGGQIAQIPVHKSSGNLTILLHGKKWTNLAFMIFTYTDTHACTQPHTHAHTYTLKWITFFFLKTLRLFTAKQFWATYWGQPVRSLCCCTFDGWSFICLTEMGCEVFVSSCVHGWNRPPLWLTDAEES